MKTLAYLLGLVVFIVALAQAESKRKSVVYPKNNKRQLLNPRFYYPNSEYFGVNRPYYIKPVAPVPRPYFSDPYNPEFYQVPVPIPVERPLIPYGIPVAQVPMKMPDGRIRYMNGPYLSDEVPVQKVVSIKAPPGVALYQSYLPYRDKYRYRQYAQLDGNNKPAKGNFCEAKILEEVTTAKPNTITTVRSKENCTTDTVPSNSDTVPSNSDTVPSNSKSAPNRIQAVNQTDNSAAAVSNTTKVVENCTAVTSNDTKTSENGSTTGSSNNSKVSENCTCAYTTTTQATIQAANQTDNSTAAVSNATKVVENGTAVTSNDTKTSENSTAAGSTNNTQVAENCTNSDNQSTPTNITTASNTNASTNAVKVPSKPSSASTNYLPPAKVEYVENFDQFQPNYNATALGTANSSKSSIEPGVAPEQPKNESLSTANSTKTCLEPGVPPEQPNNETLATSNSTKSSLEPGAAPELPKNETDANSGNGTNSKRKSKDDAENPYLVYRKLGLLLDNLPSMVEVNRNKVIPADLPPIPVTSAKRKRHQFTYSRHRYVE